MNLTEFYVINKDFREYVDRCCASRGVFVEDCLKWRITREVAEYYKKGEQL